MIINKRINLIKYLNQVSLNIATFNGTIGNKITHVYTINGNAFDTWNREEYDAIGVTDFESFEYGKSYIIITENNSSFNLDVGDQTLNSISITNTLQMDLYKGISSNIYQNYPYSKIAYSLSDSQTWSNAFIEYNKEEYESIGIADFNNFVDGKVYIIVSSSVPYTLWNSSFMPINYEMVTVDGFKIGKFEVTISQYATFLNAIAKDDVNHIYSSSMALDLNIAGISQTGESGSYNYTVIAPSGITQQGSSSPGDRPISYISWINAARFTNWMSNGNPVGPQDSTTTENGTYDLSNIVNTAPAKNTINPNTESPPIYFIPTQEEWNKAAYGSATGVDWVYATQSNSAPGSLIGGQPNQANYSFYRYPATGSIGYFENQNYLTDVGAFYNSPSYYGTFDQNGNVAELAVASGGQIIALGGSWLSDFESYLKKTGVITVDLFFEDPSIGFRLAGPDLDSDSDSDSDNN